VVLGSSKKHRYRSTDWEVFHGYSVAAGAGLAFFQHKDPAAAYAYAARQAFGSIDIREAAQLRATCPRHNDHEYVLLVNNIVDRDDEFLNAIQRFARGAERSWPSSTWWPPPA